MQAPMFFEESGHSHAFAEGDKHMNGVLIRGQGKAKKIIYEFPAGKCDTFSVKDLIDAAEAELDTLCTIPFHLIVASLIHKLITFLPSYSSECS